MNKTKRFYLCLTSLSVTISCIVFVVYCQYYILSHLSFLQSSRIIQTAMSGTNVETPTAVDLFNEWDGIDEEAGKEIWSAQTRVLENAIATVVGLHVAARDHPTKFKRLLEVNGIMTDESHCQAAYSLHIYNVFMKNISIAGDDSLRTPSEKLLYEDGPVTDRIKRKGARQIKTNHGKRQLAQLCWMIHSVVFLMPKRFPSFMRAMQFRAGVFDDALWSIEPPTLFHKDYKTYLLFPICGWKNLAMMFGMLRNGTYFDPNQKNELSTELSDTGKFLDVMDSIERHFKVKVDAKLDNGKTIEQQQMKWQNRDFDITASDAEGIAFEVLGITPLYWKVQHDFCHEFYMEHRDLWDESYTTQPKESFLDHCCYVESRLLGEPSQPLNDHSPQGSEPWNDEVDDSDYDLDLLSDEEEIPRSDGHGYFTIKLKKKVGKNKAGGKRQKKSESFIFPPDLRNEIVHLAALEVKKKLEHDGRPIDHQLHWGDVMEKKLEYRTRNRKTSVSSGQAGGEETKKIKVTIKKLGDGGAPTVFSIENTFSEEYNAYDRWATNQTPFCRDTKSEGATSNIALFCHCHKCASGNCGMGDSCLMGPLMKSGKNNSVASVSASEFEECKMNMASELCNLFIDSANLVMEEVLILHGMDPSAGERSENSVEATVDPLNDATNAMSVDSHTTPPGEDSVDRSEENGSEDSDADVSEKLPKRRRVSMGDQGRLGTKESENIFQDSESDLSSSEEMPNKSANQEDQCMGLDVDDDASADSGSTTTEPMSTNELFRSIITLSREEAREIAVLFAAVRKHRLSEIKYLPRQYCNVDLSKCGRKGNFHRHKDWQGILGGYCLQDFYANIWVSDKAGCGRVRMPTIDELAVITFINGYGPCETEVQWYRDDKKLASITTGTTTIHGQLGCQGCSKHMSATIDKKAAKIGGVQGTSMIRKIDTFRHTLCPCCDPDEYRLAIEMDELGPGSTARVSANGGDGNVYCLYNQLDTMEQRRKTVPGAVPTLINDGIPTIKEKVAKGSQLFDDKLVKKFDVQPPGFVEHFISTQISGNRPLRRPRTTVGLASSKRCETLSHVEFFRRILDLKKIVEVVDSQMHRCLSQAVYQPYEAGKLAYPGETIRRENTPLGGSNRKSNVVNKSCPQLVCVYHAYKNDPHSFRKWFQFVNDINNTDRWDLQNHEHLGEIRSIYEKLPYLRIHGFGGSMVHSGTNEPKPSDATPGDAAYTCSFDQKHTNSETSFFLDAVEDSRVMGVCICLEQWGEDFYRGRSDKKEETVAEPGKDGKNGAKKKKTGKEELTFLGYFFVSSVTRKCYTWEQIMGIYSDELESYRKRSDIQENLTHMLDKFFDFELRPAMTTEQFIESLDKSRTYEVVPVDEKDNRPLTVTFEEVEGIVDQREYKGCSNPMAMVRSSDIIRYHCQLPDDEFESRVLATYSDDNVTHLRSTVYEKCLSIKEAATVAMFVQAASAFRFDRDISIASYEFKDGEVLKTVSCPTPLMKKPTDYLPDALRSAPLPCANSDYDVNVQFNRHQMFLLMDSLFPVNNKGERTGEGVGLQPRYTCEDGTAISFYVDLSRPLLRDFVVECMFMSTVSRVSGSINYLSCFESKIVPGSRLPVREEATMFADFLVSAAYKGKTMAPVISEQHQHAIPEKIRNNATHFKRSNLGRSLRVHGYQP